MPASAARHIMLINHPPRSNACADRCLHLQIEELEAAVASRQRETDAAVAAEAAKGRATIAAITEQNQALKQEISDLETRVRTAKLEAAHVLEASKAQRDGYRATKKEKEGEIKAKVEYLETVASTVGLSSPRQEGGSGNNAFDRLLSEMESLVEDELKTVEQ